MLSGVVVLEVFSFAAQNFKYGEGAWVGGINNKQTSQREMSWGAAGGGFGNNTFGGGGGGFGGADTGWAGSRSPP